MVSVFAGCKVVEAAPDWITATGKGAEQCESIVQIGESILAERQGSGYYGAKAGFQGYRGFGAEGCFYGIRQDGACLRVSGAIARQACESIRDAELHVTRFDLQTTVQLNKDAVRLARRLVDDVRREHTGKSGGSQRATKLIDAGSNGSTAYFGARSAPLYCRIYDKHRESAGTYSAGAWRAEAEYKRALATATFKRAGEQDYRPSICASLVRASLARCGINLLYATLSDEKLPQVPRVQTDVERQLAWLRDTVAPVLRKLYSAGYHDEATNALYAWLMPEAIDELAGA